MRKLRAENEQLQTLQTATSLEQRLVETVIEKNTRMEALLRMQAITAIALLFGLVLGGFLSEGVRLIIHGVGRRRYLGIIDVLERTINLLRTR